MSGNSYQNYRVLHTPEIDELLNTEQEVKYIETPIKDHRRQPGRLKIMNDATKPIIAKRMLEANEAGERLTYTELGKELNITGGTVSRTLKEIRQQWRETSIRDWNKLVQHELAVLNALEEEAWTAWQESKSDAVTFKESTNEHGEYKEEFIRKGQTGDVKYLAEINRCIGQRIKLLGLEPDQTVEIKTWQDKLVEYLKDGRISYENLVEELGPSMAKTFLKRANMLPDNVD